MDFPHAKTVKTLPRLFEQIQSVTVPSKVNIAYLKGIGFTSSNDSVLPKLLRGIGFVDSAGSPTELWKRYRGGDSRKIMARAVRTGYATLYETYPDAHRRDNEAIANLVRQNSDYGNDTVARVVATFRALCDMSDFSEDHAPDSQQGTASEASASMPQLPSQLGDRGTSADSAQPAINLNIQLELPPNADEAFYDAFFAAMKKHLMP